MRRFFMGFIMMGLLLSFASAGVIKTSKTSVAFKGFGKIITHSTTRLQGMKQYEEKNTSFEGQGLMGAVTGRFMNTGKEGEITALDELKIYRINFKKKQYTVSPIEKLNYEKPASSAKEEQETENEPAEKSNIRIIRRVFKVTDSGQDQMINQFKSHKYTILWVTQWKNMETGETGTDSLFTVVWTTKPSADLQKAQEEELQFGKAYMKKVGLDLSESQSDILGLRWLAQFQQMNRQENTPEKVEASQMAGELKKIKGFPVLVDGSYYAIRPHKKKVEEEEKTDISDLKSMFGGFMKKAIKKRMKKDNEKIEDKAAFTYHTELISVKIANLSGDDFAVPDGFERVDK